MNPDHNRRIIFSGAFGIGKTYFLNEFFKEKRSEYIPVFLRPINYSLLLNEDVFKFVKYDILAQLVQNEKFRVEDNFEFSVAEYVGFYTGQNGFSILFNLLKYAPKVGAFVKVSEKLGVLVDKFKKGLKEINENPELKILKEFGEQTENHFLYENDGVTDFISDQLDKLVKSVDGEGDKPKKILIIDDLDRLDPEHIFRLFNIFSVHFDLVDDNSNKFGFDKIIFVCDIENIRKIFAHKYGSEVDFSGYVDKFYSTEVYKFFHNVSFSEEIYPYFEKILQDSFQDNYNSMFLNSTKLILQILFENNELSVRDMEKVSKLNYGFMYTRTIIPFESCGAPKDSFISTYGLLISIKLFLNVFDNKDVLIKKIANAVTNNSLNKDRGYYKGEVGTIMPQLILFSELDNHKFQTKDVELSLTLVNGETIQYNITATPASEAISGSLLRYRIVIQRQKNNLVGDFPRLLLKSIENIFKYGLLK